MHFTIQLANTISTLVHAAFHQYVNAIFKSRLPLRSRCNVALLHLAHWNHFYAFDGDMACCLSSPQTQALTLRWPIAFELVMCICIKPVAVNILRFTANPAHAQEAVTFADARIWPAAATVPKRRQCNCIAVLSP